MHPRMQCHEITMQYDVIMLDNIMNHAMSHDIALHHTIPFMNKENYDPSEKKTGGSISLKNTNSVAGEQFTLLCRKASVHRKYMFFHRRRYEQVPQRFDIDSFQMGSGQTGSSQKFRNFP